ncbi:MAG TPA: PQQ-dependent sugar dehydrogenase, partial [Nannocystaceae bacterium]|nr:PQQ-dependent sugar dehydrogenase [Nannocystaceae bacterium]
MRLLRLPLLACALASTAACRDAAGDGEDGGAGSSGSEGGSTGTSGETGEPEIPARPDTQPCRFDGQAPGLLPELALEPYFVAAALDEVAAVAAIDDRLIVAASDGRVLVGGPDDAELALVVDLASRGRVVAIAPSPEFAANGHVFVRYEAAQGPGRAIVARLTVDPTTWTAELASERSVMEIDAAVGERSGSVLAFDATGMLVIGVGDLGGGAQTGEAADPTSRVGKLLRIDVAPLDDTGAFATPADNPFLGLGGNADEVWALGLRDPSHCEPADGTALWCTDVGEFEQEVDRVTAGVDLGWPKVDGTSCRLPGGDCSDLGTTPPSAAYRSVDGDCAIAGVLAGGGAGLESALLFADRCSGRLRGVDTADPSGVVQDEILGEEDDGILALARAGDGSALAITGQMGVARIVVEPSAAEFPRRLSDSGCFADLPALAPVPGVVPYKVNAELWSDGASKHRFIALPPQVGIAVADDGALEFPIGTVLLKTFSFDLTGDDVAQPVPVETRVMVRREHGWQFHSYRWTEAGDDAELLTAGDAAMLSVDDGGVPVQFEYSWPSRGNCKVCHGMGTSQALGPRLDQLDAERSYGGVLRNQLDVLDELEMFAGGLASANATWEAMPEIGDAAVESAPRARAYLHTNCGHCHRPGGWTPGDLTLDLRWTTSLAATHTCGVATQYYNPFVKGEVRIVAGDP